MKRKLVRGGILISCCLSILWLTCPRRLKIDDAGKPQSFLFTTGCHPSFPYFLKLQIEGELNGKAFVYLSQLPLDPTDHSLPKRDIYLTSEINGGVFDQNLNREYAGKSFYVIYQPLTATSGEVEISVNYPWLCPLGR